MVERYGDDVAEVGADGPADTTHREVGFRSARISPDIQAVVTIASKEIDPDVVSPARCRVGEEEDILQRIIVFGDIDEGGVGGIPDVEIEVRAGRYSQFDADVLIR